jgi:hypothetical protein
MPTLPDGWRIVEIRERASHRYGFDVVIYNRICGGKLYGIAMTIQAAARAAIANIPQTV